MSDKHYSPESGSQPDDWVVHDDLDRTTVPSMAVVEAVADATDSDPTAMPPLGYTVDTDALNALLDANEPVSVSFEYHDLTVHVERDSSLMIRLDPRPT